MWSVNICVQIAIPITILINVDTIQFDATFHIELLDILDVYKNILDNLPNFLKYIRLDCKITVVEIVDMFSKNGQ